MREEIVGFPYCWKTTFCWRKQIIQLYTPLKIILMVILIHEMVKKQQHIHHYGQMVTCTNAIAPFVVAQFSVCVCMCVCVCVGGGVMFSPGFVMMCYVSYLLGSKGWVLCSLYSSL